MKLDIDCVRDVLICVEENTGPDRFCVFIDEIKMPGICAALGRDPVPLQEYQKALQGSYSNETLVYHVKYCIEAGLLACTGGTAGYEIMIPDLSARGHDFLQKCKNEKDKSKLARLLEGLAPLASGAMQQAVGNGLSGGVKATASFLKNLL